MSRALRLAPLLVSLACAGTPAPPPAASPVALAVARFAAFEPWARPIDDYLAVGAKVFPESFDTRIRDLKAHGERLYIGYGDGRVNMGGHIPIELRYFDSPDAPAPASAFTTQDEVVTRYRVVGGELMIAGPDATDADELAARPGIMGNVYHSADGVSWRKHRTVVGGEHVHDVAAFGDAVYLVGSGAADRAEWESGKVFRYLWRTSDRGASVQVASRAYNDAGDTRWTALLPTRTTLLAFGFISDREGKNRRVLNVQHTGGDAVEVLSEAELLGRVDASLTEALPDGGGLVAGSEGGRAAVWHVSADGAATELTALAGFTVVDVAPQPDSGELLYLLVEGENPKAGAPRTVVIAAAPMSAPGSTTELSRFTTDMAPSCIEQWRGDLYMGAEGGVVLRARRGAP